MKLSLSTIQPNKKAVKDRKRIGRGGKRGTYAGRGLKGQKSRSGASGLKRLGMRQLVEQTPKLRGFKSHNLKPETVNLADITARFKADDKITPESLKEKRLIDKITQGVKILGSGEIKFKVQIERCEVSASAKQKIEAVGGSFK